MKKKNFNHKLLNTDYQPNIKHLISLASHDIEAKILFREKYGTGYRIQGVGAEHGPQETEWKAQVI